MKLFKSKKKLVKVNKDVGGDYGIHFPWITLLFLIVGIASEVTDSLLLVDVLSPILSGLPTYMIYIISFITGSICFFSMAAVGYQSANDKVPYNTKVIEIAIWFLTGAYLVWLRINVAVFEFENFATFFSDKEVVMGGLTFLLYLGTGFMTYASAKQLSNRKLYEYLMAKREYDKLMNSLLDLKEEIEDGIAALELYQGYASRLTESKNCCLDNIDSYNQSVKALIEAKIALMTEPYQMDDIYGKTIEKEQYFEGITN